MEQDLVKKELMIETLESVREKVRNVIVDSLGVDEDEVVATASLRSNLGAESIDWLDITFRLEKGFGIKIPRGELFPLEILNDPESVVDGKLTVHGIQVIQTQYPDTIGSDLVVEIPVDDINNKILTVEYIERYITRRLREASRLRE